MATAVTSGIKISVDTNYRAKYSDPAQRQFLFSYTVEIENLNDFAVQLLRRHWYIFDSVGVMREVEGEGVIGLQPIIEAGDSYSYESACHLSTDMGKMRGFYHIVKVLDGMPFDVEIPEFQMIAPNRLN